MGDKHAGDRVQEVELALHVQDEAQILHDLQTIPKRTLGHDAFWLSIIFIKGERCRKRGDEMAYPFCGTELEDALLHCHHCNGLNSGFELRFPCARMLRKRKTTRNFQLNSDGKYSTWYCGTLKAMVVRVSLQGQGKRAKGRGS